MKINNLLNRGITLIVIVLFIGVSCIPTGITSKVAPLDDIQKEPHGFFFGLKGHIKFDFNLDDFLEPIEPGGGGWFLYNVSYKVSGIFADIIARWFHGRVFMTIELSIKDVPEWASISVFPDTVHFDISSDWETPIESPAILIILNESAPAFNISYFKIVGTTNCTKGPFGILTWIHGSKVEKEFPIVPGYLPLINVTPETNNIHTPPGQITELNISIENLGNGLTLVKSEIIDSPSPNWWVYIQPETVLDVGEEKEASLFIMPPENYTGNDSINLTFTPCYYYDPNNPELQGMPITEVITVRSQP